MIIIAVNEDNSSDVYATSSEEIDTTETAAIRPKKRPGIGMRNIMLVEVDEEPLSVQGESYQVYHDIDNHYNDRTARTIWICGMDGFSSD